MTDPVNAASFPSIFYGNAPTTRSAWRAVLAAAWKKGSFADVVNSLEMVPVGDRPGDIIISMPRRDNFKKHETHWWLLWVSKDRPAALRSLTGAKRATNRATSKRRASLDREKSLILDGMRYFWFTVGLLADSIGHDRWFEYARNSTPESMRETLLLPMLRRYISWLPELLALRQRYASVAILYWRHPDFRHAWVHGMMQCAIHCGYEFDQRDWIGTINSKYGGDPIRALVESGIAERAGSRFQLREDTRKDSAPGK